MLFTHLLLIPYITIHLVISSPIPVPAPALDHDPQSQFLASDSSRTVYHLHPPPVPFQQLHSANRNIYSTRILNAAMKPLP